MTIDVKGTRRCCSSGLACLFHIGKLHSNHTFLEPEENSWDCCIKNNPTLVNVIESSHTYNCVPIHALRGSYNCCLDGTVAIWKVTMFQFTTTSVTPVLTWSVFMKCRLSLMQINTTVSKGSMPCGPTINLYYNGKNI